MNRRRFLVSLAVVLLLAVFIAAKIAMSWRPVALGRVTGVSRTGTHSPAIEASEQYLEMQGVLFHLPSGANRRLEGSWRMTYGGAWKWNVVGEEPHERRLVVRKGQGATKSYVIPPVEDKSDFGEHFYPVQITPELDRVELVGGASGIRYLRWSLRSGRLERQSLFSHKAGGYRALSRDGETLLYFDGSRIKAYSTVNGDKIRDLTLKGGTVNGGDGQFSRYGTYATIDVKNSAGLARWSIIETTAGREIASYPQVFGEYEVATVFSPDEQWLAYPTNANGRWEIYDTAGATVIRRIKLPASVRNFAFSPDKSTLYFIANGVLYRQRAR